MLLAAPSYVAVIFVLATAVTCVPVANHRQCHVWRLSKPWRPQQPQQPQQPTDESLLHRLHYSACLVAKYLKDSRLLTKDYQLDMMQFRLWSKYEAQRWDSEVKKLAQRFGINLSGEQHLLDAEAAAKDGGSAGGNPLSLADHHFQNLALITFLVERLHAEETAIEMMQRGVKDFANQLEAIKSSLVSAFLQLHQMLFLLGRRLGYDDLEHYRKRFQEIGDVIHSEREWRYLRDFLMSGVALKTIEAALMDFQLLRDCLSDQEISNPAQ